MLNLKQFFLTKFFICLFLLFYTIIALSSDKYKDLDYTLIGFLMALLSMGIIFNFTNYFATVRAHSPLEEISRITNLIDNKFIIYFVVFLFTLAINIYGCVKLFQKSVEKMESPNDLILVYLQNTSTFLLWSLIDLLLKKAHRVSLISSYSNRICIPIFLLSIYKWFSLILYVQKIRTRNWSNEGAFGGIKLYGIFLLFMSLFRPVREETHQYFKPISSLLIVIVLGLFWGNWNSRTAIEKENSELITMYTIEINIVAFFTIFDCLIYWFYFKRQRKNFLSYRHDRQNVIIFF